MTFLPIVNRELRVASRRRGTYWSRALTACAAILAGSVVYMMVYQDPPHDQAGTLFDVISVGAFIYCLLAGVRSTADCLSEEKREGTLGLLFLTDLKGYDVVGGKLVATSLNSFYGLTAIFPVLAIPLLMGGVTNGEFWRRSLVLANTFFFSLALGMFFSSITKSPRKAMAGTFLSLLFLTVGLIWLIDWAPNLIRNHDLRHAGTLLNPCYSFALSSDARFKVAAHDFKVSAGIIHGLAWLLLALASIIVPRSWQDHPLGATGGQWRALWHRWSFGDAASRLAFRRRLLDRNAFFWLAGRARLKPLHVWAALAFIACLWIWGALENGRDWTVGVCYFVTGIVLNTTLKLWIASEAGRRLGEDRKIGALELILSTPLTVRDILRGQMLALRRQFLGPLLAVILVETVFLLAAVRGGRSDDGSLAADVALWLAGLLMLVADMLALSLVAMWVGLTARNPNHTTGITVRRVLVLPLAVSLAIMFFFGIFFARFVDSDFGWQFFLGVWFVPGIIADLVFGLRAWFRLRGEFRVMAAQRFSQPVSFFRRWFGGGNQPTAH